MQQRNHRRYCAAWIVCGLRENILSPIRQVTRPIVLILTGVLFACTSTSAPTPRPATKSIEIDGSKTTELEHLECITAGGEIVTPGFGTQSQCSLPYQDAGVECRDISDCIGTCRVETIEQFEILGHGQCHANSGDWAGCYYLVRKGKAERICVD